MNGTDSRFFQALQTVERFELREGELQIAYAGGTLRFARAATPAGSSPQAQ